MKRFIATLAMVIGLLGFAGPVVAEPLDPVDASRDRICLTLHLGTLGSPRSCAPLV